VYGRNVTGENVRDRSVLVDGVALDACTEQEVVDAIVSEARAGRGGWVVTVNLDILRHLHRDSKLRAMVSKATLVVADGMPVLWAAKLAGTSLPERVTGASLIWTLSGAADDDLSIYLLGGVPGVADAAAQSLVTRHPRLRIAGTDSPPLGFDAQPEHLDRARRKLVAAAPDIVFCGLGFPKQERVICELRRGLPGAWFIGCGAAIPFAAGHLKRAPAWMQRCGLEWLHRLLREPIRLFRRYLVDGLCYAAALMLRSARARRRSTARPERLGRARSVRSRSS
jgi:N-acetylglucosaminyldiphosphoundecaprenol N-acetyl-beta-D-mannosaminyltransferase